MIFSACIIRIFKHIQADSPKKRVESVFCIHYINLQELGSRQKQANLTTKYLICSVDKNLALTIR